MDRNNRGALADTECDCLNPRVPYLEVVLPGMCAPTKKLADTLDHAVAHFHMAMLVLVYQSTLQHHHHHQGVSWCSTAAGLNVVPILQCAPLLSFPEWFLCSPVSVHGLGVSGASKRQTESAS